MKAIWLRVWRYVCGRCPLCGGRLELVPEGFAGWHLTCENVKTCGYWRAR